MDWPQLASSVLAEVLPPLLTGAVTALVAWIVARIPVVRDYLASGTHERDVRLVTDSLANGATASARRVLAGEITMQGAVMETLAHAQTGVGQVLAKIKPDAGALRTMAEAMVTKALPVAREAADLAAGAAAHAADGARAD